MTGGYNSQTILLVILTAGVGTLVLRLSFILLFGRLDRIPPQVIGILRFVPAAVLAALIVPAIVVLSVEPSFGLSFEWPMLLAGAIAAIIAWRTENVLATIGIGMIALWTFQISL
ncbi:AzlD domain-containing protein [Natronosalvus rutilus]|uniref:AzlD domain-containing protein n=1 Tax=Natronosalvus rutilus TaxID=2953753 RepID=A0A9E7NC64_9EURY|nr:AzlD domain-containing protein [Natronosalvus rutilus]UTF55754.1 AzlD domain-containing protein [Natronosalvus rutilus]